MSSKETSSVDTDIIKLLASIKEDIHSSREESKNRGDKAEEQIQKINTRLESVDKRLDEMDTAMRRQDASGATFKYEFKKLERRLDEQDELVRRKIRQQEDNDEKVRSVSETTLEHEAHLGLAIGHIGKLEERLGSVEEKIGAVDGKQDQANEAIGAMVEEMGVEGKVKLGRSLPPGVHRKPVLTQISDDAQKATENSKKTTIASFGAALLIIVQIVWHLLEGHK